MLHDFLRAIGAGRVKTGIKLTIARHRDALPIRLLHQAATFIEQAHANEGADFATNGEQELLSKLKQADFRTAIDVGANRGDWSIAAMSTWPNCRVHAFEVAPNTFRELQASIRATRYSDRIVMNDFGVSDGSGTRTMYYYPNMPEFTGEARRHADQEAIPFEARLSTLDAYCVEQGIDHVNFLKVDVEGAEHRVFKGFSEFLKGKLVDCIQFEYGAFSIETRFLLADYFSMLSDRYWMGKIYPKYVDFREYNWQMENFKFCNYICVSRNRPDLKKLLEA